MRKIRADELRQRFDYIAAQVGPGLVSAAVDVARLHAQTRQLQQISGARQQRSWHTCMHASGLCRQANEAAAVAEAERQALAMRLGDKAARGEALAGQRQALLTEMASLRQAMQRQEEVLRASLLRMRQKGSVALPEEVVRSLEAFQVGKGGSLIRDSPSCKPGPMQGSEGA